MQSQTMVDKGISQAKFFFLNSLIFTLEWLFRRRSLGEGCPGRKVKSFAHDCLLTADNPEDERKLIMAMENSVVKDFIWTKSLKFFYITPKLKDSVKLKA